MRTLCLRYNPLGSWLEEQILRSKKGAAQAVSLHNYRETFAQNPNLLEILRPYFDKNWI